MESTYKGIIDTKREKKTKSGKFILIVCGAVIGFVNGLFGGGGGMICVPILRKFLNYSTKEAHASSIGIIFPLSLFSAFVYVFNDEIPKIPLIYVTLGVVIGGILGAILLKKVPEKAVGIIFSILMIVAGIRMII